MQATFDEEPDGLLYWYRNVHPDRFSLLLGEDVLGFIGKPGFDIFTSYANLIFEFCV